MTDYYVDPLTGSDSNAGTSTGAAWLTIPGTRTTGDSGYISGSWGAINTGNKIAAGDRIYLRGGTTAIGGRLIVDTNYYNNGTSGNEIVIQVHPTWGSGDYTMNSSGVTIPQYFAHVFIRLNYLTFSGASYSRQIKIMNASVGNGFGIMMYGGSGAHTTNIVSEYLDVSRCTNCVGIGYTDNGILRKSHIHDADETGVQLGLAADIPNNDWLLEDLEVYRNGLTTSGTENLPHGLQIVGSFTWTCRRVRAWGQRRDGFDIGTAAGDNSGDCTGDLIDCDAFANGEDGYGINGGAGTIEVDYINCAAWDNGNGMQIYDGPDVGIYHCVMGMNNTNPSFGGNILTYTDPGYPRPNITIRNSIFYKPKAFCQIAGYNQASEPPNIDSDYNIYTARDTNTENAFDWPYGTVTNYNSPPSFIGTNDILGIAADPGFVNSSPRDRFERANFHLTSTNSIAYQSGVTIAGKPLAATDRDGNTRSATPSLGMYEI